MDKPSNHRLTPRVEYFPRHLKPVGYFLLALTIFKLYVGLGLTIHAQMSRWLASFREAAPDLLAAIVCFKFAAQNRNWASENTAPSLLRKDARELTILVWLLGALILPWPYGPFISALSSGLIYAWAVRDIRSREKTMETNHLIEVIIKQRN
jgi:hypothetical protein